MTTPITILGIAGSLRKASYNRGALRAAQQLAPADAPIEIFELDGIPPFDQDQDTQPPEKVARLKSRVRAADAVLFVTPEYNYSIPGVLKNAIDWASRPAFQSVLAYKPVAVMATSRGPLGGARCLEHMRVALDSCLSRIALAREVIITAAESKIRDGRLVDETSLGFACGAVEALLREIRLWQPVAAAQA